MIKKIVKTFIIIFSIANLIIYSVVLYLTFILSSLSNYKIVVSTNTINEFIPEFIIMTIFIPLGIYYVIKLLKRCYIK